jgi:hypothetical protein
VRRRVLGPEIEGEIAQGSFGHGGLVQPRVQRWFQLCRMGHPASVSPAKA